jgi:hypothetical protein
VISNESAKNTAVLTVLGQSYGVLTAFCNRQTLTVYHRHRHRGVEHRGVHGEHRHGAQP